MWQAIQKEQTVFEKLRCYFYCSSFISVLVFMLSSCSSTDKFTHETGNIDSQSSTESTDTNTGYDTDTGSDTNDVDTQTNSDSETETETDTETDTETCVSEVVDCSVLCGPVPDNCTDEIHNCGGCEGDFVCDIVDNLCKPSLITCEDLSAQCGTIRNSCGVRLFCGYCDSDQECNPDTNQCINCTQSTCQDLGYECGEAWSRCGEPFSGDNNLTCSECTGGMICNLNSKLCEPDCTADSDENVCLSAELEQGIECGIISDGCGGIVDCEDNCPPGEHCGVRGVANRCDKPERPLECEILGWNCGDLESACSGTVNCGECPQGEVCNINHVCGPMCYPLTCETGYAGQCGQQLDDGCGGFVDCLCNLDLTCNSTAPGETERQYCIRG